MVQDSIRTVETDLINLIFGGDDAIIYVCGDANNMSKDVNETIIQSTSKVLGKWKREFFEKRQNQLPVSADRWQNVSQVSFATLSSETSQSC